MSLKLTLARAVYWLKGLFEDPVAEYRDPIARAKPVPPPVCCYDAVLFTKVKILPGRPTIKEGDRFLVVDVPLPATPLPWAPQSVRGLA